MRLLFPPLAAMTGLVALSNVLVQYPLSDWLTWGAFTYPLCFLVTDLTNRMHGPAMARRIVYVGFAAAVVLSILLATPRIAAASGLAFLTAQLLDVTVFDRMRHRAWWQAPLASSMIGSAIDTTLFFSLAFYGTGLPWLTLAIGDFLWKATFALLMLLPFRLMMPVTASQAAR
ncbi:MAG: queuosine precursor transporter [Alphaproteobacteria bacterium]|nr:queuosine precursor transporter [Alphaproteobacteria bacterium]MCY4319418.1 queuosine precursor transporter [Alphaproteobacteria bacterium]